MGQPAVVAVTGAAGFLGGHVCRALTARGHRTIAMVRFNSDRRMHDGLTQHAEVREGDVLDGVSLDAALAEADVVVHCAARVSIEIADGGQTRAVNATGTRTLIQACIRQGIPRLVHVSSVHAYTRLRGTELNPNSQLADHSPVPYCAAKAEAQRAVLQAMAQGQIGGCVVCPGGIIGPGDARPSPVGRLLLDIAHRKLPLLINEGYWWCDVRDVADAVACAISAATNGDVYFVPGRYAKFARLAGICSDILGCDVTRPAVPYWLALAGLPAVRAYAASRRMSPLYTRASLYLARNCPARVAAESAQGTLGYRARPLEESIRDSLAWSREQGLLA